MNNQGKTKKEIAKFFQDIIEINPDDYLALFEVAEYEFSNKQYSKALAKYLKILQLSPRMKMVYVNMGSCYYNLGNPDLALEYFKKAKDAGQYVPDVFFEKLEREK